MFGERKGSPVPPKLCQRGTNQTGVSSLCVQRWAWGMSSHAWCCRLGADHHSLLDWSVTPTAATALAVSTESSQEAIDHLDGTENHLDPSDDQQNGEEGEIPGDHIAGFFTLAPQGLVIKIITIVEGVSPGAIGHEAFRTLVDGNG